MWGDSESANKNTSIYVSRKFSEPLNKKFSKIRASNLVKAIRLCSWFSNNADNAQNIPERCGYIQHYGGNCVHPYHRYDPMAMPTPGAQLVLYPGCKNEQYYFCYTLAGELKHKRSGLCIESQLAGEEHRWNDIPLRLNTCGKDYQRFRLTPGKKRTVG